MPLRPSGITIRHIDVRASQAVVLPIRAIRELITLRFLGRDRVISHHSDQVGRDLGS